MVSVRTEVSDKLCIKKTLLEQLDSDIRSHIMSYSEKRTATLVTILVIVSWTKSIFKHGQQFGVNSPYMEFGRIRVIHD